MDRLFHGALLSLALLFVVSAPVKAVVSDDAFRLGVAAFQAGDFPSARRHFEQAQRDGLNTAALHYNLGSTYYRLQRYDLAKNSFSTCADDPAWAALAHYNLGLVAVAEERNKDAAREFMLTWRATDDQTLEQLAYAMLERTDPLAIAEPRSQVALILGYDSNVVLGDQAGPNTYVSDGDFYWELVASAGGRVEPGADSPRWSAAFYDLRYVDLRGFSVSELALGLSFPLEGGEWSPSLGGQWRNAWRDGKGFQQVWSLRAETDNAAIRPGLGLRFSASYDLIDALDSEYSALEGRRWGFGMTFRQRVETAQWQYGVTFEHNNREDFAAQQDRYSFSPDRFGLWWRGSWPYSGRWRIDPTVRYVHAQYAGTDRHAGLRQARDDKEWQGGVSAMYRLPFPWQLVGDVLYLTNRSNFPEFDYHRFQLTIGIQRPF